MEDLTKLRSLLNTADDLSLAAALLEWDQETYMPGGAAESRARQVATLRKLAHERLTDPRVGTLLERLQGARLGEMDADLVAVARRDYDRQCRIPSRLVQDMAIASGRAKAAWHLARSTSDYRHFSPHLARIVDLSIEKAEALGYVECRYDALMDEYEPGMRTSVVQALFSSLRERLVSMVTLIGQCPAPESGFLYQAYDTGAQWDFGMDLLKTLGYDFSRGRQDVSAHPFSTSFSTTDVRITTRLNTHSLPTALFSTLHEAGHALYEQGIDPALENTPMAEGTSLQLYGNYVMLARKTIPRRQSCV